MVRSYGTESELIIKIQNEELINSKHNKYYEYNKYEYNKYYE